MKRTTWVTIILFLLTAGIYSQQGATYKEWENSMAEGQKREQTAKEKIAEEQAKIKTIKEQIKETKKQEEQTRAEILTVAGTTTEAVAQWRGLVNALFNRIESFNTAAAQDKILRQGEIPGLETEATALKQDRAALLTAGQALVSVLDNAVLNAKNGIIQAQKDIAAAAEAARLSAMDGKKRKIEEAKMAKEEAKRKMEEEKQAKLEAKRQAAEAAKQKAEEIKAASEQAAASATESGDLIPGSVYKVKNNPADRETLSKMALRLYGDPKLWTKIYEVNKGKIDTAFAGHKRRNPNSKLKEAQDFIYPGQDLIIPK